MPHTRISGNLPLLAWLFAGWALNQPIEASDLAETSSSIAEPTPMAAGCQTTGMTTAIALPAASGILARTGGVAPLAVFFDATGTTATATARPFHELEYRWDFGDLASGNWSVGARPDVPRNTATGPVAAHVYETPGIYSVRLDVTDGTNTVSNSCIQVAVKNPDLVFSGDNTICIGATSRPAQGADGCPANARTVQQPNFAAAINAYATTNKRVLFKRGDTFTTSATASITSNGPGIVGAFGTAQQVADSVKPIVQMTGDATILALSSPSTPNISDWRIMDLELDGMSSPSSRKINAGGIAGSGGIKQATFLRLLARNTSAGISFSYFGLNHYNGHTNRSYRGHAMWDQIAIADTSILNTIGRTVGNGGVGITVSAKRFAMLGNDVDDTTQGEQVVRIYYLNKGVISNNTLGRQALAKSVIKLHGSSWCSGSGPCDYSTVRPPAGLGGADGGYSEQIVISGNKLESIQPWAVVVGPQNTHEDERLRNVVFERNWIAGNGARNQACFIANASDITIRNNICMNTGGIGVFRQGIEPPPDNVHIYNNTVYSTTVVTNDIFTGVGILSPATNTVVRNNLILAPYYRGLRPVTNTGANTDIQGNSTGNIAPSALFVSAAPKAPADFHLAAGSPARNAGVTAPVWSDFFSANRSQNGMPGNDMGAIEE